MNCGARRIAAELFPVISAPGSLKEETGNSVETHDCWGFFARMEANLWKELSLGGDECGGGHAVTSECAVMATYGNTVAALTAPFGWFTFSKCVEVGMTEQRLSFGPELRRLRIAAGMSLTRLAGLLHYSKGHVSKVETGLKQPTPEFAQLGQTASPAVVLPALIAQTQMVQGIAAQSDSHMQSSALMVAARYAEYVGWMCQEAGNDEAALWWTDRAVELASAGGDRDLASYALVRRALMALYRNAAAETVELSRAAQLGSVAQLSVAANNTEVPELFRHLIPTPPPPGQLPFESLDGDQQFPNGSFHGESDGITRFPGAGLPAGSFSDVSPVANGCGTLMDTRDLSNEERALFSRNVAALIEKFGKPDEAYEIRRCFDAPSTDKEAPDLSEPDEPQGL